MGGESEGEEGVAKAKGLAILPLDESKLGLFRLSEEWLRIGFFIILGERGFKRTIKYRFHLYSFDLDSFVYRKQVACRIQDILASKREIKKK